MLTEVMVSIILIQKLVREVKVDQEGVEVVPVVELMIFQLHLQMQLEEDTDLVVVEEEVLRVLLVLVLAVLVETVLELQEMQMQDSMVVMEVMVCMETEQQMVLVAMISVLEEMQELVEAVGHLV